MWMQHHCKLRCEFRWKPIQNFGDFQRSTAQALAGTACSFRHALWCSAGSENYLWKCARLLSRIRLMRFKLVTKGQPVQYLSCVPFLYPCALCYPEPYSVCLHNVNFNSSILDVQEELVSRVLALEKSLPSLFDACLEAASLENKPWNLFGNLELLLAEETEDLVRKLLGLRIALNPELNVGVLVYRSGNCHSFTVSQPATF